MKGFYVYWQPFHTCIFSHSVFLGGIGPNNRGRLLTLHTNLDQRGHAHNMFYCIFILCAWAFLSTIIVDSDSLLVQMLIEDKF
jgi:hypothetical protein